jgi:hypothetical protein
MMFSVTENAPEPSAPPPRRSRRRALAELYVWTGALAFAGCALGVATVAALGHMLTDPNGLARELGRGRPGRVESFAGGVLFALALFGFLGYVLYRLARGMLRVTRGLLSARALLEGTPAARTLVATRVVDGGGRGLELALEARGVDPVAPRYVLEMPVTLGPGWSREGESQVRVYGLDGRRDVLVLESERGRLALGFPRQP